ncbi:MAG: rRNA pseudouridine synthase [Synechococcales cyanobacterium RM1_1_8]|nr:rRNA pseudouridine synthase [Synechococcales cyanobacterium RM1_1_8]
MAERLQKILSQWGVASRRKAETLILEGRVQLNGTLATLGQQADPQRDQISVDGQLVSPAQKPSPIYLLLNKPRGVVSTCHDPEGRPTVLSLLPPQWRQRQGIHPVGRLDTYSTGALLLTNDGALTYHMTHPRHEVEKVYEVTVEGHPTEHSLAQWRRGMLLEGAKGSLGRDRPTLPAQVQRLHQSPHSTCLRIVLREGRNRQIRRIAEQLGHPVKKLHRLAIGPIALGPLALGDYRELSGEESRQLQPTPPQWSKKTKPG